MSTHLKVVADRVASTIIPGVGMPDPKRVKYVDVPLVWRGAKCGAALLTEDWFRMAMKPRYSADGAVLYCLTPPRRFSSPWATVLGSVGLFGLMVYGFIWGLLR